MTPLYATDLLQFQRQFRFTGGRLRRMRFINRRGEAAIELILAVRTAPKSLGDSAEPVLLRLRIDGVEEYRFQKRPTMIAGKLSDCRLGYFQDLFFINLDAWGLPAGEVPKAHDFRASDAYAAGRSMAWEIISKNK